MTLTAEHGHEEAAGGEPPHGHHQSPAQRHRKEHLALWLFIGGDVVFFALTIFTWFYTRALNTNGMWRGASCTRANPCTDGLGNPLTHEVPTANPWYGVVVAVLIVVAAVLAWSAERSSVQRAGRSSITGASGMALVAVLAAVVVQCIEFGALPFTTIVGTYASTYEFFMGSTLAHALVLSFLALGFLVRSRAGRYDDGQWYQLRLYRIFAVWIAVSVCVLTFVSSVFT